MWLLIFITGIASKIATIKCGTKEREGDNHQLLQNFQLDAAQKVHVSF